MLVDVGPRRRARRGWLGQPRWELLFGEPPEPVAKAHAAEQLLVPVDPAHRDLKCLGDLFHREVSAHRAAPETRRRQVLGRAWVAGAP
jgi:hypothetical protein